jgi:hypothetical protein
MPPIDESPGHPAGQLDVQWDPWRPDQVVGLLQSVTARWYVAGGWALDLYRGGQSREHGDLEVAVPATAFDQVRQALGDYQFEVAGDGRLWSLDGPAFATLHQTWVSEPAPGRPRDRVYRLDVFREPARDGRWACRRDERILVPYERVIGRDFAGIPYLAPEIALLFKAKHVRQKDDADFVGVLPLLTAGARGWLRHQLCRLHPGHAWIEAL